MKKLTRYRLAKYDGPYERWPKETELIKGGMSTGKKIPGYVIEAQYQHSDDFLFVTSWDCPFEETPSFLLLSHELDIIVEKTIVDAYTLLWIEGHESVNNKPVIFRCNNDLGILVTVESLKTLRLEKRHSSSGEKTTYY